MPRKTWNVGEVLTAGDMNVYVRDNSVIRCTSTTRPVGLGAADRGQYIFETDTGYEYVYYGTTSGFLPVWRGAWGLIGSLPVAASGNFAADSNIATLSAAIIPGRNYKISGQSRWTNQGAAATIVFPRFVVTNATLATNAGNTVGENSSSVPGGVNQATTIPLSALFSVSAAAAVNVGLWAQAPGGSVRHENGFYTLEDVGPSATSPAA